MTPSSHLIHLTHLTPIILRGYLFFNCFYNFLDVFVFLAWFRLATRTQHLHLTSHTSPTSPPSFQGPEQHVKTRHSGPRYLFLKLFFFIVFNVFFFFSLVSTSHWDMTPSSHLTHPTCCWFRRLPLRFGLQSDHRRYWGSDRLLRHQGRSHLEWRWWVFSFTVTLLKVLMAAFRSHSSRYGQQVVV